MSFCWTKYLDVAKELAGQPVNAEVSKEARLRTAISRAYYAVFQTLKEYLLEKGETPSYKKNVHEWVKERFDLPGNNTIQQRIADDIDQLRKRRNSADYDADYKGWLKERRTMAQEAAKAIEEAERILQNLEELKRKTQ